MKKKPINPKMLAAPFGLYSHGMNISEITEMVRSSGQLSIDPDGFIPQSAYEQAKMIFSNLSAILEEANMSVDNVVHIGAYVTDRIYMAEYMKARDEFLGADISSPPTSTLLIVSGFTKPEFKVEVEITAVS